MKKRTIVIGDVILIAAIAIAFVATVLSPGSKNQSSDASETINLFASYFDSNSYAINEPANEIIMGDFESYSITAQDDASGLITLYTFNSSKNAKQVIERLKNTSNDAYTVSTNNVDGKEIVYLKGDGITYAICQVKSNVVIAFDFNTDFNNTFNTFTQFLGTI